MWSYRVKMDIKRLIHCLLFFIVINVSKCIKTKELNHPSPPIGYGLKSNSETSNKFWLYWKAKLDSPNVKRIRKSRSPGAGFDYTRYDDNDYYDDSHLYLNKKYPLVGLFGSTFFYNPANAPYCQRGGKSSSRRPYKLLDYDYDSNPFNSAHGHIPKPPPEFRGSVFK